MTDANLAQSLRRAVKPLVLLLTAMAGLWSAALGFSNERLATVAYEQMKGQVLFNFADMCGWALARSHAKSGDGARLSGYIGKSDQLDAALIGYAQRYADQCEADFEVFQKAIRSGKIPVEIEPVDT